MNPTVKKKTKVPTLTITIKRCLGSINHSNWGGERINAIQIGKEENFTVCR